MKILLFVDSLLDILVLSIAKEIEFEKRFKWGLGDAVGRALPDNEQILMLCIMNQLLMTNKMDLKGENSLDCGFIIRYSCLIHS